MNAEAESTTPIDAGTETAHSAGADPRAVTDSREVTDPCAVTEKWTAFAAWAADELGCRLAYDGAAYRLDPLEPADEEGAPSESGLRRSWFRRRTAAEEPRPDAADTPPPFHAEHPADIVAELVERLGARGGPPNARPVDPPESVHDLSARMFAAYTLDGGQAHLAGFHLEDWPLVRLTTVGETEEDTPSVHHAYCDELGRPLDAELVQSLGVDRVAPTAAATPRLDDGRRERMLESARSTAHPNGADGAPALATIVWVKRATGRVRFEFGEESIDAKFDGWAQTLQPPPVVCPASGRPTYHLATVEGGAIAAAEQIAECSVTGHRRVLADLGRCASTDRLAEPEWLAECPVSGETVLRTELHACRLCDQQVSRSASPEGVCRACREKQRVATGDPRVARLLDAHPALRGWSSWRVSETRDVLIAESKRRLRCVQWVFDRTKLELLHAVATPRLLSSWRPLSREQRERLLR